MMRSYVAGFLFNDEGDQVALVLKNRPEWQAGLYNAIGGKVEEGESFREAMTREFNEEAGVEAAWDYRTTLRGDDFVVNFYTIFSSKLLEQVHTKTDEPIEVVNAIQLPINVIPNIRWLVPLLSDRAISVPETFTEVSFR